MSSKSAARRSPSSVSSGSSTSLRQVTPLKLVIPSSAGHRQADSGRPSHYDARQCHYDYKARLVKTNLGNFDRHFRDLENYRLLNPPHFDTYEAFRPTGLAYSTLLASHELCAAAIQELIGLANPSEQRASLAEYQNVIDTQVAVLEDAYEYAQPLKQRVLDTINASGSPPLPRAIPPRTPPSTDRLEPSTSVPETNLTLATAPDADQRCDSMSSQPTHITLADAMRIAHSTVNPQRDQSTSTTSYRTPPAEGSNPSKVATTQERSGSKTRGSSNNSVSTTSSRTKARIAQREAALSLRELEQAHRLEEEEERAELEAERIADEAKAEAERIAVEAKQEAERAAAEAERKAAAAKRDVERKRAAIRREKERLSALTRVRAAEYIRKYIDQEYFEQELDTDEDGDSSSALINPLTAPQAASTTQQAVPTIQRTAPMVQAPDTATSNRNAALTGQLPPVPATTARVDQARTGVDQGRLPPISTHGDGFNPNARPFLPSHLASGSTRPPQQHFVRSSPYTYAPNGFQPAPTPPTSSGMVGESLQWLQALVFRPSDRAKFEGKSEK